MAGAKVLIVEDHPIFRMGLRELINQESGFEVCGEADDVAGARKAIDTVEPDIAVVDLSLKNSNGMDLIKELSAGDRHIPVVVLSMHDEEVYAERCLQAGAKGYIMKQEASLSVVKAIRSVLAGNCYVSERVMTQVINRLQRDDEPVRGSPLDILTDRELEVFQLLGKGLTSGDIAKRLNLSVKTVGTYRERIKDKLGFKRCGELVRIAVLWTENRDPEDPRR
ncbi:MAG: response regulator transcription factor [Pseudomonadota bacterium]